MPLQDDDTQLALLTQRISSLVDEIKLGNVEMRKLIQDHEERLRVIESKVTELGVRQTMLAVIQSSFTAVASGVAALIGKS